MARNDKNNVDYFPFLCKEGKAMYYIENKYGNDGYATWVKILRELAITSNHWLNLADPIQMMFLASKCKISEEKLNDIISDLCTLGEFHIDLWNENKIIFSEKFIENIKDAYKKRKNDCISLDDLFLLLSDLGLRKSNKSSSEVSENPHRIEYNIIEDNTILKNKKEEVFFPENLNSENFKSKWNEWMVYRKEIKKPIKSIKSQNALLKQLGQYNEEFVMCLIDRSITRQWQGLIFDNTDSEFKNFNYGKIKGNTAKGDASRPRAFGQL